MVGATATLIASPAAPALATPAAPSAQAAAIDWQPCPSDDHPDKMCAKVRVPRDYARPRGRTVSIALAKVPATGTAEQRIGTLFWDAGGPGGPSTQIVDMFADRVPPTVRRRFDFVAFDPRGVGDSTPTMRDCAGPWPVRPTGTSTPNWRTVRTESAEKLARDNRACLSRNARIAAWMGTTNVARDLDRLRRAVGDAQLSFWATSYGTRIAYVYALRYPERVRAMVLDGNIDPSTDFVGLPKVGGSSQDLALQFIKRNYRPAYRAIMRTASALLDDAIPLPDGTVFSRWDWLDVAGDYVAFQDGWPSLPALADNVLAGRIDNDRGRAIREQLVDTKARPNSNEGGVFSTVNCLDYAQRLSPGRETALIRANSSRYPVFGGSLTTMYGIGCAGLGGLEPDPIPLVTTAAQRAVLAEVPVVLANATHDGSTPLVWAKQMAAAFGDRPIIKYRSGQHVIWGAVDSRCVNRPINRFMTSLREPARSRTCAFVPPQ